MFRLLVIEPVTSPFRRRRLNLKSPLTLPFYSQTVAREPEESKN
jgi:hypothetical protein